MSIQKLPLEILYNISQYLNVQDVVDFQEAVPEVSQCGIFSDLEKENEQNQKVAKQFHEWILFSYKKHEDFKERVLNSFGFLRWKINVLTKINIKIADQLFQDLDVYYSVKEKLRKEHNMLAKVMNLEEIQKEADECPSCKRSFEETEKMRDHHEYHFPSCYEEFHPNYRSIIPVLTIRI